MGGADLKYCEEEGRLAQVTPVASRSALLETLERNVNEEAQGSVVCFLSAMCGT